MARKHEAERLLRTGLSPSQIASEMDISVKSVLQYLQTRVGEGALKVSDLLFSIPSDMRAKFAAAMVERNGAQSISWHKLKRGTYCREELDLYCQLSNQVTLAGDLYEDIAAIEVQLHDLVRAVLSKEYGQDTWWRDGIPLPIRKDCVSRREEDDHPSDDEFSYTTFINLKAIIDKNWTVFRGAFPHQWSTNKKELLKDLDRLNTIRNGVMHPVKKRRWAEDDFEFVRNFRRELGQSEV